MIAAIISTAVSRLSDIILSAYIYNSDYRYPCFITFIQFAALTVFVKAYTLIRESKCVSRAIKDDDVLSPTTQTLRRPKVSKRFTLLLAASWFLTRIFFNLNNVQVRIARASEAAVPLILLPACSYLGLVHLNAPVAALTLASSLALIVNGSVDAEAITAAAVLIQFIKVVSQAAFLTCLTKTIKEHYANPVFALNAYAPTAAIISLACSIAFEGLVPLHDLPIIGLVILIENVVIFLASQLSIAFLLQQSNVITWSSVSHLVTVSLVIISSLVTQQAPPLGQSVVTFCSAFLSALLLRTQLPEAKKTVHTTPKLHLSKLSSHLDISHVTGLQPLSTPPTLSRTNSSQRMQHPQAEEI
ncbi:hypothetical protein E3P99_00477 [Wallemia hederae]|uniref:Sugar phosphate transporter domain-containing protein n=1 Tax=Wallemia hederae TaxID=1540922 RepID=A0A4T0FWW7_9BASI|nr:hypothetical protein E3P99_00477 [Wallemia hederae]